MSRKCEIALGLSYPAPMWIARVVLFAVVPLMASAAPMRVLCWNIHHGVGMDGQLDLKRIARVIAAANPDVVALQEVDRHCARSGEVDQAAELGRLLEMTPVFGKALDLGGGEYGLAVLSKFPIVRHEVHRLPGEGEPRIALEVRLRSKTGAFSLTNVHLDHRGAEPRLLQAEALDKLLTGESPMILCGDFNAPPRSDTMAAFHDWKMVAKKGDRLTQPADKPKVEIDHVLVRGFTCPEGASVIKEKEASDHRPLVLTLERTQP